LATKKRQKQLKKIKQRKQMKERKAPLVKMPSDPTVHIPTVNYNAWMRAIADRDPKVWDAMISYLLFFEKHHYKAFGVQAIKSMNEFGQVVYSTLADEEMSPTLDQATKLVQMGHLFQHLMAVCAHETNDAAIKNVLLQQGNVPKLLFLLNPRCNMQVDQSKLFEVEPFLTSIWFNTYMLGISTPTKTIQTNIYRHLHCMDERWTPPHHCLTGLYFTCTYHNPESAKRVKGIINKGIKSKSLPTFNNNPDPKSIAIVTNKWHRNHAVYKSASTLVEQLKGKYKLTLVWTAPKDRMPDTIVDDYFDKVVNCYFQPGGHLTIPNELKDNDFQMVYFPDIGMTDESVWLSNCRIAPIQAMGYGHPETSGDNSEIDYFIGGDIEKQSTDQYSETMVLLPGLAQEPAWPTAERKYNYIDDGIVRMNCVWGPDKYNSTLLSLLVEINNRVWKKDPKSKHEIHLFASPGINRYAALPSFRNEISRILPNAEIHSEQEYYDYMENAEMHDFSLNSFPFGCYNVLIESLYLGLPFLTLVGNRFYNRAGMWLNEQIDMDCNNFNTTGDFIDQATRLVTEPDRLKEQREHLASIDLKERLFTLRGNHFLEAVEYIVENHPFIETKIIGEDK
jgi:hypothetical protein